MTIERRETDGSQYSEKPPLQMNDDEFAEWLRDQTEEPSEPPPLVIWALVIAFGLGCWGVFEFYYWMLDLAGRS